MIQYIFLVSLILDTLNKKNKLVEGTQNTICCGNLRQELIDMNTADEDPPEAIKRCFNYGYTYDEEVYNKLIKEITEYHEEAYLKSDKQNSCDAQLRETFEQATEAISNTDRALKAGQPAVEAAKQACELIDKLQKENKELKEEKEQMEQEYLLAIGSLMIHLFRSDEEKVKEFMENNTETATLALTTLARAAKSTI